MYIIVHSIQHKKQLHFTVLKYTEFVTSIDLSVCGLTWLMGQAIAAVWQ